MLKMSVFNTALTQPINGSPLEVPAPVPVFLFDVENLLVPPVEGST